MQLTCSLYLVHLYFSMENQVLIFHLSTVQEEEHKSGSSKLKGRMGEGRRERKRKGEEKVRGREKRKEEEGFGGEKNHPEKTLRNNFTLQRFLAPLGCLAP